MGMRLSELILLGLVAWTVIGLVGSAIAKTRGEEARFRRGLAVLGVGWAGYLTVLFAVSFFQKGRVYRPGEERCLKTICLMVEATDEVQGFWARGQERERLLRVVVRVRNRERSGTEGEAGLVAYLVDAQGRRWEPVPGLSGVPLSVPVVPGSSVLSTPVFRVAKDATGLRMVLHHRQWTMARMRIGDGESWAHRPTEMELRLR